jgi:hypothetical protein
MYIVNETIMSYNKAVHTNVENMQEMLQSVAHQINIAYVTPGLVKFIDPLVKLYGIMAETVNLPTTPNLKTTVPVNLTNAFKQSEQILNGGIPTAPVG